MRDIEFRGKRVSDGEWIYGYLSDINEICNINEVATPREEVDDMTVGEYTGYRDVNDKKIFEGDIIREVESGVIGYISWLKQEAGWVIVWEHFDTRLGHRHRGYGYDYDDSIEVVGNMEDNFEMIEWLNNKKKN